MKIFIGILFGVLLGNSGAATPEEDFKARCDAPGVVKCLGFDNATGITLMGAAKIDNTMKSSGAGSMRVEIAPSAGDSPGNIVTKLGANFGEGSTLHMQWRQRFSPEMVATNLGGEGFKQFVIYDGTPCGPNMEVAMLNQNYAGFPIFYSACGNSYFRKSLGGSNYALMWNQDGNICTNQDPSGCLRYKPDQWMTFSYEQRIGKWGQPNSVVKVWMAEEGKPLKQFIDLADYTFKSDNANSAYRDLWVGPFSLGRKANQSFPTANTWFDEFIISTQPIAAPGGSPTGARDPLSRAQGRESGIDVQTSPFQAKVTLGFPNPGGRAEVVIHDMRGGIAGRFSGVRGRTLEWDASRTGKGIYVIKVESGSESITRKISVL